MKALIDADLFTYEFGSMVQLEQPDQPLEWPICRSLVDARIETVLKAVDASSHALYLTDGASNFRLNVGTILPYKGQRKEEKPFHYYNIRQHLIDNWDAEVQYGIEADDRLGIEQCEAYKGDLGAYFGRPKWLFDDLKDFEHPNVPVICSRDKDMHMIPGWHYTWECGNQKERLWFQNETDAIRCFYSQLLVGDSTDNILCLYGCGPSSVLVRRLGDMTDEQEMFNHVFKAYQDRFGSYAEQFMWENAALLWILREEPCAIEGTDERLRPLSPLAIIPQNEVHKRLDNLYEEKNKENNT